MNKVGFVMSSLLTIVGLLLIAGAQAVSYLAFKTFGGTYSTGEYAANLTGLYIIGVISIVAGVFLSVLFYKKGIKKE
jgi:uncharacterized membrane protein YidH (DUF202 family)